MNPSEDAHQQQMQHYRRTITIEELVQEGKEGKEWVIYEIIDRLVDDTGGYLRNTGGWNKQPYHPDPGSSLSVGKSSDPERPHQHPSMFTQDVNPGERDRALHEAVRKAIDKWLPDGGAKFQTIFYNEFRRELKTMKDSYTPDRIMSMEDLQQFTGLKDPAEPSNLPPEADELTENQRRYTALQLRLSGRLINKALMARAVGVSRQAIYYYERELGSSFSKDTEG